MEPSTPTPAVATPPPPPHGQCANCGAPLYGKYCYACGQPTDGLVRHFSSVLADATDSIFNIDERVFKTLAPLYLHPGQLTLDYFAGKRARYVTPFRLVFFLAIIAFFAIQLSVRAGFGHAAQFETPRVAGIAIASGQPESTAGTNGRFSHGDIRFNGRVWWNQQSKPLRVGWLPGPANDWLNDLISNAQRQLYAMNSGSDASRLDAGRKFTLHMFSAAPTVLFVLLPVFALLLKIAYVFKRRLYMEHLIVAMHSHAFLMLSMLVLLVLAVVRAWLVPHAGWLGVPITLAEIAAWSWIFVYVWLMQKRVYRQGWFMTNVKYFGLGSCYAILLFVGFVFVALLALTGA